MKGQTREFGVKPKVRAPFFFRLIVFSFQSQFGLFKFMQKKSPSEVTLGNTLMVWVQIALLATDTWLLTASVVSNLFLVCALLKKAA